MSDCTSFTSYLDVSSCLLRLLASRCVQSKLVLCPSLSQLVLFDTASKARNNITYRSFKLGGAAKLPDLSKYWSSGRVLDGDRLITTKLGVKILWDTRVISIVLVRPLSLTK